MNKEENVNPEERQEYRDKVIVSMIPFVALVVYLSNIVYQSCFVWGIK